MEYKDYYATLGVPRSASQADIKKAFRKLARQHHPDVNKGDASSERRFKEVNEAHDVLSDPDKRKAYDELGANWEAYQRAASGGGAGGGARGAGSPFAGFGGSEGFSGFGGPGSGNVRFEFHGDPEDLAGYSDFFRTFFAGGRSGVRERERTRRRAEDAAASSRFDDLFGGLGGLDFDEGPGATSSARRRPGTRGPSRGPDHEGDAEIGLEEAFTGTARLIQVGDKRLDVKIPAGVDTGHRIRLSGRTGAADGGDIYLNIKVREHPVFQRTGADLHRELPITLEEALLGREVEVETLTGRVLLRIPPETQTGRTFRLAGQGMPRFRGHGRGDLYVKTRLVLPTGLNEEARRRFRAFAEYVAQPDPRASRTARARSSNP